MLGLRVMKCSSSHLTRTVPGFSVRVEPGGKISVLQCVRFVWFFIFAQEKSCGGVKNK